MRIPILLIALHLFSSAPVVLIAQAAPPASTASGPASISAPHERLTFFEGLWTVEEVPGAREFRERCAWLEGGRRHMVCRSRSKNAAGLWRDGLSLFSYRAADSVYVYYGLRPSGATQTLTGRSSASGESWDFWGEEGEGANKERTVVRIVRLPAGRFRFVEQTARGGLPFVTADTVHYRPARAEPGLP